MQRVANVTLNVFCEECNTFHEVVFTNDEWEYNFWVDNPCTPVVEVTCPNCGHLEDVSLY